MNKKVTAVLAVVIVILVIGVGALYFSGMLNFNSSTQANSLQSTPSTRAPNIVSSSVVSKDLGSKWTMTMGASGSTLNASTFISGQNGVPLIAQAQVSPEFTTGNIVSSPFTSFGLGNNVTYNTYQAAVFVPPETGYAVISFAHSTSSSVPGYVVSTISSEISAHFSGKTSYNSTAISFKIGTASGSNYVFVSEQTDLFQYAPGAWYLEGVLANYSSYNIMFLYYTPHFLNVTNFTAILTTQVSNLKSPSTPSVPSVLISSSDMNKMTNLSYKTQSAIAVNLNDTKRLLNEYIDMTGASRSVSSTNRTILNNTIGTVTGLAAKYMMSGRTNYTEATIIGFSNSSAPKVLFDLLDAQGDNSGLKLANYSGWSYAFQNTTLYNYQYHFNQTTHSYTYNKTAYANETTVVAVNGKYMLIFETYQSNGVFTQGLAKQLLSDESGLI
ncbi:MAG: hypothetical protein M1375_01405 [Candidatus Thermoplasmatota archaeon]|jgi:hypothetical protein|nr:hypothetical protein [Candidatus Thermoplasmatota archaeon]MCL5790614.1 hypothetical protein [Candidatus Thermoplasmatota archaeon]